MFLKEINKAEHFLPQRKIAEITFLSDEGS